MAYNQVGTPKFYIDNVSWLRSIGYGQLYPDQTVDEDIWGLNVSNPATVAANVGDNDFIDYYYYPFPITHLWSGDDPPTAPDPNRYLTIGYNFCMVLGHKLATDKGMFDELAWALKHSAEAGGAGGTVYNHFHYGTDVVNCSFQYDGFSINEFPETSMLHDSCFLRYTYNPNMDSTLAGEPIRIGRVIAGKYFEMPHSPDLELTISYETGTKTIETRGGASLSNTMWRPPMWGDLAPWELYDPTSVYGETDSGFGDPDAYPQGGQPLARSSRRTWDLSFSFLDKTDTFAKNNTLFDYVNGNDPSAAIPNNDHILTSEDFFSQVWNKVGTALPFVFQPDKDVNEFAICKFKEGFSFKQVANGVYNFDMKIRESW